MQTCKYECQFASAITQNTCKIQHNLNCDDKFLIYLLTCKQPFKQYILETTDAFRKHMKQV